jgi:hypothetical protein
MTEEQKRIVFQAIQVLETNGIVDWQTDPDAEQQYAEVTLVRTGKRATAFCNRSYKVAKIAVIPQEGESNDAGQ